MPVSNKKQEFEQRKRVKRLDDMALVGPVFLYLSSQGFATCHVARESEKVLSSLPLAAREKRVTSCRAWETGLHVQYFGQLARRAARD